MIVSFTVGVWTARYLGPERLGILSYAQSFVFLFSAFASLGLDGIVVRELVKTPEKRDEILGTAFVLKVAGAVISLILLSTAVFLMNTDRTTAIIMILIGAAPLFQAFNVIDFYFQSRVESKYVVYAQFISMLIVNGIKVLLILYGAELIWFGVVILLEAILFATGLFGYYLHNRISVQQWLFKIKTAKSLMRDSWPLILSGVMVSLYMKIDQVMIIHMLGEEANGQYAAAVRLSEMWYFMPAILSSTFYPALLKAKQANQTQYTIYLQQMYSVMTSIGIVIILPQFLLRETIITTLFGSQYIESVSVYGISLFAVILVFISAVHGKWLLIEEYQHYSLYYSITGCFTNILANYFLIPRIGIAGAAYATLMSQVVPYLFLLRNTKTRNQFKMIIKSFMGQFLIQGISKFRKNL